MRSPALFKRHLGLLSLILLLRIASTAEAVPPWNVGYRTIAVRDTLTGEWFPVVLWYPTLTAPTPLFVTGSLSPCRLPAILCREIAYAMPVAQDAPVAEGRSG
jgi:hypothetical protein